MRIIRQGIATTQFLLFGKKHFTQTGYLNHLKHYKDPFQSAAIATDPSDSDGVDLNGKNIIITGANQGIGKEIATYAASKNANVYMLCRNQERANIAKEEIKQLTNNPNINILVADVSEPNQIKKIVEEFEKKESKLDCLVCNAGALLNNRQVNSDGMEVTFMGHFVSGTYLLTKLLIPLLKAAGVESRVVYVSSGGMYSTKFPDWEVAASSGEHESSYNGNFAYAYAKRGQVILAERFSKEYPEISFVSAHPGWVRTAAVDAAYGSTAQYLEPMRTTWEGAEGICWLTSTARKNLEDGAFYLDREVQRKHIGGLFMTEGSFTKNSEKEVVSLMDKLKEFCGV